MQQGQMQWQAPNVPQPQPQSQPQPQPQSQSQQDPKQQKGIQCPACGVFNKFSCDGTRHMPGGFTERTKGCTMCGHRIITAEVYVKPAPAKKARGT